MMTTSIISSITRNGPLLSALLLSLIVHLGLFYQMPAATPQMKEAQSRQPLALKLGTPIVQQNPTVTKQPIDKALVMTKAKQASAIAPKKETPKPEAVKKPKGQTEELVVTKEVKLSAQPIPPVYPEAARRKKQQGLVMVRAQVDPLGKTHEVKVAKSSGFPLLDQAAIDAVIQWSFLPAQKNGKTIMAWIEVPIDFKLR